MIFVEECVILRAALDERAGWTGRARNATDEGYKA